MEVRITKRVDHFPQKYLAEWSLSGLGYSCWFHTQKELMEYFASWNAKVIATNFKFRKRG